MERSNSAIFTPLLKKLETVKYSETVSRHRPRAGGASPAVAGRWEVGGGRDLWWEDWPPTGARCGSVGGGGWEDTANATEAPSQRFYHPDQSLICPVLGRML